MQRLFENGLSLKTQIIGLILLFAVLSFFARLVVSINTTKEYMQDQMGSHAQDTATSLGLSIAPYLDENNHIIAETMISAIFDAGYYASIELKDNTGKVLISRTNPTTIATVPTWFLEYFPLLAPTRESQIHNGWQHAGAIYVTSHLGVSYQKLWQHSVDNFYAALITLLICLGVALIILQAVLKPLKKIARQAKLVTQKQFTLYDEQPFTKELRTVTLATNNMVRNLQKTFSTLTQQTQRLTAEVYLDELTKLGNRRAFENHYLARCRDVTNDAPLTLFLITLPSLHNMNSTLNYQSGDCYINEAKKIIEEVFYHVNDCKIFRISGGSFIVTSPLEHGMLNDRKTQLLKLFSQPCKNNYLNGFANLSFQTIYAPAELSSVLSALDTAATFSTKTNNNPNDSTKFSVQQWKTIIHSILETGDISYTMQPILNTSNSQPYYFEVFAKFNYQDKTLNNGHLFAMAERLGLTVELDKQLIRNFTMIKTLYPERLFALNLSHGSIYDADFLGWLKLYAHTNPCIKHNLLFEISETALLHNVEAAANSIGLFRSLGISVCIEHFGTSLTSFKYLQGLDIECVKLDGSFVQDLTDNVQSQFFINTVNTICHGFGIKVLTCLIEDTNTLKILHQLGCDGLQGRAVQAPTKITEEQTSFSFDFPPNTLNLLN